MAFDQATRNRLQKFVGDARKLLSEEFTQQLQNAYGLDPVTGGIAELSALPALSPSEQQTATLLRDTLEHYLAASHKADPHKDKTIVIAALDRIVREQAFTVLNRLAALRMAEARQFVMESISHGYQSKGFQLYQRIAGSSLGETGQAYQHYLFSVFDELSLDLAVLFDRYSSQGRLFPRETVLLELLDLINHAELEMLWGEDETVGWIYQYFNSIEERRQMRAESGAPRNSRELAVRNQFFTPRYVVQFLTDNTLGRIWYEMTKGKTALVEGCLYLVRRPNEVFLKPGEQTPDQNKIEEAELSQEELLKKNVYIQHRQIKDPRDIKVLDPACGSMHFGLYAFDLLEKIYAEAWGFEQEKGFKIFAREDGSHQRAPLRETYISKKAFLADVPRLIIEHNIHGVDIDPRATQIAGLSLWLRAQKSWSENGIGPNDRPRVQRSNIVCAEPMPGEISLLKEFTSQIQPRVLGQLVEEIFDKMQLAGEAGALLKIEEEIQFAIDEAKKQKDEGGHWEQGGLFGDAKWEAREGTRYNFDGGVSEDFWSEAELLILAELERYAESASGSGAGQKRLFAADAAKGFSFIDLSRKRFDVLLMNPPFGEPAISTRDYLYNEYEYATTDILIAFIERARGISDKVGVISNRTPFFLQSFTSWRESYLYRMNLLETYADLGDGVLDAMVEASAYILGQSSINKSDFYDVRESECKADDLMRLIKAEEISSNSNHFIRSSKDFDKLPGKPLAYWAEEHKQKDGVPLEPHWGELIRGPESHDLFRDVRCWWEVEKEKIGKTDWAWYAKGGDFKRFSTDIHLLINIGKEIRHSGSVFRRTGDKSAYWKQGVTYTQRTSRDISFRVLPENCLTSPKGPAILAKDELYLLAILALSNTRSFQSLVDLRVGASGAAARSYDLGILREVILPDLDDDLVVELADRAKKILLSSMELDYNLEESVDFKPGSMIKNSNVDRCYADYVDDAQHLLDNISEEYGSLDSFVGELYGFDYSEAKLNPDDVYEISSLKEFYQRLLSYLVGVVFSRWQYQQETDLDLFSPRIPLVNSCIGENSFFDSEELSRLVLKEAENIFSSDDLSNIEDSFVKAGCEVYIELSNPSKYFDFHLKMYSRSRRQAPVYWPLQTSDKRYCYWVYYPLISNQTLFDIVNNKVDPEISVLKSKVLDAGKTDVNNEAELSSSLENLEFFRDELLRISKYWKPDFNDGVIVSAAPLWSLFQHGSWRKKLRKTWDELESGKHDWSHISYSIWPDRVIRKSHQDIDVAISHDLESELWEYVETQNGSRSSKWIWRPKKFSHDDLGAYIENKIAQG